MSLLLVVLVAGGGCATAATSCLSLFGVCFTCAVGVPPTAEAARAEAAPTTTADDVTPTF